MRNEAQSNTPNMTPTATIRATTNMVDDPFGRSCLFGDVASPASVSCIANFSSVLVDTYVVPFLWTDGPAFGEEVPREASAVFARMR
jgi:hypothetical protein